MDLKIKSCASEAGGAGGGREAGGGGGDRNGPMESIPGARMEEGAGRRNPIPFGGDTALDGDPGDLGGGGGPAAAVSAVSASESASESHGGGGRTAPLPQEPGRTHGKFSRISGSVSPEAPLMSNPRLPLVFLQNGGSRLGDLPDLGHDRHVHVDDLRGVGGGETALLDVDKPVIQLRQRQPVAGKAFGKRHRRESQQQPFSSPLHVLAAEAAKQQKDLILMKLQPGQGTAPGAPQYLLLKQPCFMPPRSPEAQGGPPSELLPEPDAEEEEEENGGGSGGREHEDPGASELSETETGSQSSDESTCSSEEDDDFFDGDCDPCAMTDEE